MNKQFIMHNGYTPYGKIKPMLVNIHIGVGWVYTKARYTQLWDDMTNKHLLENKTKVLYLNELSLPSCCLGESIVP
jgi:hypothetical protein